MNSRIDYLAAGGGILGGLSGVALVCFLVGLIAAQFPGAALAIAALTILGALGGAAVGADEIGRYFGLGSYLNKPNADDRIAGAIFGTGASVIGLIIPGLVIVGVFLGGLLDFAIGEVELFFAQLPVKK